VLKAPEDLESLIKVRISDHQAVEQEKLETERVRIQQEEESKAKDKVEVEQQAERINQAQQQKPAFTAANAKPLEMQSPEAYQPPHSVYDEINHAEEMVTITRTEYTNLILASELLSALQAVGVDNWDGYSDAMEMLNAA
jgi:preprotein translocase subunit SecD